MAESVTITNLPDSGSPARVAYDLWLVLRRMRQGPGSFAALVAADLELYTACLKAASGHSYDLTNLT